MAGGRDTPRDVDSLVWMLAQPSIRAAIDCLREEGQVEYEDLIARLEQCEHVEDARLELHHRVLPRLSEQGLIESNASGAIRLHANNELEHMLDTIAEFDYLQEASVLNVDE